MSFNVDWVMAGAVIITGLSVVFVALVLLWGVMVLMGKLIGSVSGGKSTKKEKPAAVQTQPIAKTQPTLAAQQAEVGDDVVAAITAAIAAMTGSTNFVVKSIRRSSRARSAWALAGIEQNTHSF